MSITRSSVTSWLELAGLLFLAAAASVAVWRYTVPGALAVGGVLLIAESAFVTWRATPQPRRDDTA